MNGKSLASMWNKARVIGRIAGATAIAACCLTATNVRAESVKGEVESPPTVADEWDLAKDFAKIDQQWASIFAVLENDDYFSIRVEDVSLWSCGQQAGHLALAMNGTADSIEELLAKPNQNTDGMLTAITNQLLTSGIIPRGVGQAPEAIRPENTSREELLKTLQDAKKKWAALEKKQDAIAQCKARAQHPTGTMLSSEWVRLMAVHNAHHLKIIRDILAASGDAGSQFGPELKSADEQTSD